MPFIGETSIRTGASSAGAADLGDEIANSLRLNDDDTARLEKTFSGAGTSRRTKTISAWIKQCSTKEQHILSTQDGGSDTGERFYITSSGQLAYQNRSAGTALDLVVTTRVLRDASSWTHVCAIIDTTEATASDRVKFYINGVQDTDLSSTNYPTLNHDGFIGHSVLHRVGCHPGFSSANDHADMYITGLILVDGQALSPTNFGRFSASHPNVWVPITPSGITYGSNGFHLDFAVAPGTGNGAGTDVSGNGNHFTDTNLTAEDQSTNTPTNVVALLSPLYNTHLVFSDGLTKITGSATNWDSSITSFGAADGKFYREFVYETQPSAGNFMHLGMVPMVNAQALSTTFGGDSNGDNSIDYAASGVVSIEGVTQFTGTSYSAGTTNIGLALDLVNQKAYFRLNGVWQNSADPAAGTGGVALPEGGEWGFFAGGYNLSVVRDLPTEDDWTYAAPTGFSSLRQANLPAATVDKPSESVQLITASGDNIVSNLDAALASGSFLKIYKNIDTGSTAWKWVFPDDTGNMWDSSVNTGKTTYSAPSGSDTFAGIGIKIDTSVGTASSEVSHTNGVATNYAHGLGVTPAFVILFPNLTANKRVFHSALDSGKLIRLDDQQAQATDSSFTVDATNVTISSSLATGDYRILAFAEIDGFSSFKFHDSNSSADGPFLHHGFSPLFEITVDIDLQDTALDWDLFSYKLESHSGNVLDQKISLNEKNAKSAIGYSGVLDHVSTGSKTRTSGSVYNTSSRHHARVAFAQAAIGGGIPFPNAR